MDGKKALGEESKTVATTTPKKHAVPERTAPKRLPPFHVVLWDDDDHTYDYVVRMMRDIFGHSYERGYQIACQVDRAGRAICMTTTKELAELKQEQIQAYGKDRMISSCAGSMSCTIEAAT